MSLALSLTLTLNMTLTLALTVTYSADRYYKKINKIWIFLFFCIFSQLEKGDVPGVAKIWPGICPALPIARASLNLSATS